MADHLDQLMNELRTALHDVEVALKARGAEESQALADIVAALDNRKSTDLSGVVKELRALRESKPPQVTVNVEPTPLTVHVAAPQVTFHSPSTENAQWEIRIQGKHGGPDTVATITRKATPNG